MITVIQFPAARVHVIHSEPLPNILDDIDSSEDEQSILNSHITRVCWLGYDANTARCLMSVT